MSTTHPTLLDVTKRTDPDGGLSMIAEILETSNPMIEDIPWVEGNLPTGHMATARTGYSDPTWRRLNAGVQPTKTTTAQITASCGMMEDYSEIDVSLASLNGNSAAWRLSEDRGKVESFAQELSTALIYYDEAATSEKITGLAALFNDTTANNGENIITSNTAGQTDNTSIWIVGWATDKVFGIYPKGSQAGLKFTDKGQVTIENAQGASGARMEAYRTHMKWDVGLMVRDWRYVVRIQFDLSATIASGASGPVLSELMGKGLRRIHNLSACRPVIYMNRDALDKYDAQAANKGTLAFRSIEDANGKMMDSFRGVRVRQCDAVLSTEASL